MLLFLKNRWFVLKNSVWVKSDKNEEYGCVGVRWAKDAALLMMKGKNIPF